MNIRGFALVGVGVVAGCVLSGIGWPSVGAQDSGRLTGQDFAEIERLYGLYNQGSDFRDAEMFLSAFSEDAVITSGGVETRGMAALRKVREERYQGQTGDNGRRHLNSSFVITPTPEGAKGRAYWVVNDVSGPEPKPVVSGYYDDVFVKTAGGWKIKSRTLVRDSADTD